MIDRVTKPDAIWSVAKADARRATRQAGRRARIFGAAILLAGAARAESLTAQPQLVAIADFDYVDTSGEPQDQSAKHLAQLQAFMASLRRDLADGEKVRVVPLSCGREPCSSGGSDPAKLIADARGAGVALLIYGGIHKTSTLVQWAKVQAVDLRADKLVLDRLLTFRGDDDTAWRRAERFLADDLKAQLSE